MSVADAINQAMRQQRREDMRTLYLNAMERRIELFSRWLDTFESSDQRRWWLRG